MFSQAWTSWFSADPRTEAVTGEVDALLRGLPERTVPDREHILRAYAGDPAQVRVIILGQDPYPTPGHAHGLAFSVPSTVPKLPPSLKNIFEELKRTHGAAPATGDLSHWESQGVLLLNRWLTLESTREHRRVWDRLIDGTLRRLVDHQARSLVVVSWGRPSIELVARVTGLGAGGGWPQPRLWLTSSHPSPLGARRPCGDAPPFLACGHFAAIDRFHRESGEESIQWTIA